MTRVAYVNGLYLPADQAVVSIEDRGFQFSDGVYEVIAVIGGELIDLELHLERLERSLNAIEIDVPVSRRAISIIMQELIRRNRVAYGKLYLQITRGRAPRDHSFPAGVKPSMVMTCSRSNVHDIARRSEEGVAVVTVDESRWAGPYIKTVSLLPNVLAKQEAQVRGAYEALFIDEDGVVTEGSSTNVWIVDEPGVLRTHPADDAILSGITRRVLFDLAEAEGMAVKEQAFGLADAKAAREVFITSTTAGVVPVISIDGDEVGTGEPGPAARQLAQRYREHLASQTQDPAAVLAVLSRC